MSDASKLATSYYPETLDRIFVVGTPSYFSTIWGWAQKWFDPITVSKIFILNEGNMKSTLEKYVDIENIPRKYGGTLDWEFGDMPNLDPAIVNTLRWKEVIESKGHKTLPIGPIKWTYDEDGDLMATAIGTEDGKQRHQPIAALHPESGIARLALSPGRADTKTLFHTTSANIPATANGSATPNGISTPSNMSSDANLNVGKSEGSAVDPASRAGTYTVPIKDNDPSTVGGAREGTSATKFEQQHATHAEGQGEDSTPEIKYDSQGEQQAIMEPNTVGQAPKEHPMPEPEEPQPSIVDQAKNMAGQALETAKQLPTTVMGVVGLGGQKEEEKSDAPQKKEDPEIDGMSQNNVEEFLRSRTMSTNEDQSSST